MEEHSDVDEADLHEEIEDDSEDVEDYSDETESDLEHGSEAQFSQAVNTIRTRSESFKYPEALYEFLYKYRDILEYSSPVSGTLLHSIASTTPEEYSDVAALAQRLIQEHPQLLCETDGERLTPLSMALVEARRHFIVTILRICSDDPNCSRALGEALQVGDRHGRTALHHLSRNPSRFKASLIVKVLSFATDGALALKDEGGRTPLYHVIKSERWRRSTIEVIKYFLARDAAAQEMSRTRELSSESIHTFLDVIDDHGLSAYEFLVPFEKNQRDRPKMKPPGPERNNDAEEPESMRPVTDRTSDQVANTSLVREYRQRLTGEVSTAVTESKICSEIAELLKLHYIRTRDIAKASRFLYGDNAEDIQLYFNYTGGPAEVKMPQFEAAFHATKFCDTLKFVAFPSSVSVVKDSSLASNISAKRAAGFGRRDMEFFAKWLQRKGVKHIMSMQVYDFNPCHSDESIGAVLQRFQIEDLDWRKIDLDPRTVQKACNEVRSLILWWSGNNTTLRAWSEPTGLPALLYLKRIRICLPREIQAADSMACVENNIAEFRKRLQGSLDAETGDIKSANHDAINASVEGNDEKGLLSASASSLVIPGTNAIVSHLSENNGGEFAGLLGVLSRVDEDESSVATALAAGIISILICCYKLIASSKELEYGSVAYKEAQRNLSYVMQPAGMKTVIKNLGDLTEDRVVQVWQRLDPVSRVLGDKYQSLEEKIDQLVTLTRQLALGLRDRG
ncbi:hypothetical protein Daus18300_000475 [Diaporthe australafricana]|uniref:Ankyrin repeat protein n=1 Tax=Diaporthe australafricana TaxID=127596 RepID=A0ABR3Y4W0_9PEZI